MINFIKSLFRSKRKPTASVADCFDTDQKPSEPYNEYGQEEITQGDITLKKGMRVICRSNENDPLIIGTIEKFFCPQHWYRSDPNTAIPMVKDEADDKIWSILGIIRPYSEALIEELKPMEPIEQWNYLAGAHCQIKEKGGKKYKTY